VAAAAKWTPAGRCAPTARRGCNCGCGRQLYHPPTLRRHNATTHGNPAGGAAAGGQLAVAGRGGGRIPGCARRFHGASACARRRRRAAVRSVVGAHLARRGPRRYCRLARNARRAHGRRGFLRLPAGRARAGVAAAGGLRAAAAALRRGATRPRRSRALRAGGVAGRGRDGRALRQGPISRPRIRLRIPWARGIWATPAAESTSRL